MSLRSVVVKKAFGRLCFSLLSPVQLAFLLSLTHVERLLAGYSFPAGSSGFRVGSLAACHSLKPPTLAVLKPCLAKMAAA
jgi:hypothetical protein